MQMPSINLPIIRVIKVVILIRMTANIITRVKMYMPVNLLNLFINNLLIIAPNTDPKGRTPIKID